MSRATYDDVLRRYADGRPMAHVQSRRQRGLEPWTMRILNALVESGDVRFAERRERRRQLAALAQRFALGAA